MNIIFRTTTDFLDAVRKDLLRPHEFADERVGFMSLRAAFAGEVLLLFPQTYHPVADEDYVRDRSFGATVGQEGLRKALELALLNPVGILHVHMHNFPGRLWFSPIDLSEQIRFVPDFFKVRPSMPHGALVLNPRAAAGRIWLSPSRIEPIREFNTLGTRFTITRSNADGSMGLRT